MSMSTHDTARALAALGHEARLEIFRLLVRAGKDGVAVGEVARHAGLPLSTLNHHLAALVGAGLVAQERQGRTVINRAVYPRMDAMIDYLTRECCAGLDETCDTAAGDAAP